MKRRAILFLFIVAVSFSVNAQMKFGEIDLPVRMTRFIGISGSTGWNGIVGIGATMQYYFSPHFGLDAGLGLASTGYKFSGRLRYLFLKKNFTPLIGVGYIYSTGYPGQIIELEDSETGTSIIIEMLPSSFIQIVGGAELVANNGFFLMGTIGYAIQLNDNINVLAGVPTQNLERAMDIVYRSGIVFEFSLGYIFGNKKKYKGTF